jgi:phosphopantothenoylcysteine decarboxylase/phosphopantothenate--cysteine ligase
MSENILLGITGSIASSKSEVLFQLLNKQNNVEIFSTNEGLKYVSQDFQNENTIYSSWDQLEGSPHIEYARWADKVIIYPATANFISKYAHGLADDLLLSTLLMFDKEIYIAPAMHEEMFMDEKIQENILNLSDKVTFCGPRFGNLDIGDQGVGRLVEPNELFDILYTKKDKVIVTSGPTSEYIDDVRVITNKSSGKQGRAIAIELMSQGYEVVYIHSKDIEPVAGVRNIIFETSEDLLKAMDSETNNLKHLFMVAAVSDFVVKKTKGKIDRSKGDVSINLSPNIDIVKEYKLKNRDVNVISFSAQTNNDLNFEKIKNKDSNYLVINNLSDNYFGSDMNKVTIINKSKMIYESGEENKHIIAQKIIQNTII